MVPSQVWTLIDIDALRDWPDYSEADAARFAHLDWPRVCELARSMVEIGSVVFPVEIPTDLPDDVQTGLHLLLVINIDTTPEQLIDGGHRLLAMRNQGVRFTVGVGPVRGHEKVPTGGQV